MLKSVTLLSGLRPYGPMATPFPEEYGRRGGEGTVVEFRTDTSEWIGNFRRGIGGIEFARAHPNKRDAVVIAGGDLWIVDPVQRTAEGPLSSIDTAIEVQDPEGWVFCIQGLALARFSAEGILWHTRRLSWDGIDQLAIANGEVRGLAFDPMTNSWSPFRVDIRTGRSIGGSYSFDDADTWERLADDW